MLLLLKYKTLKYKSCSNGFHVSKQRPWQRSYFEEVLMLKLRNSIASGHLAPLGWAPSRYRPGV